MKTTVKLYSAENRKFLASLQGHREDPDRREVIGHIMLVVDGFEYMRNVREEDELNIEALQKEILGIHQGKVVKP